MQSIPELICYVGRRMFERRLTDMAGGNISVRDEENIYITPRYSAAHKHWQLDPTDILSMPVGSTDLLEDTRFSREGKMHLAVFENYPDARVVLHAHSFNIQPFVAACKPIPPVLEATRKYGVIDLVEPAPAHSDQLAKNVVAGIADKQDKIRSNAAAVLIPYHGIVIVGKELMGALDSLERIDWNAWCVLSSRLIN